MMKKKLKLIALISPVIFILDQITKYAIVATMKIGESFPVIPGFFDIVHVRNKGAAFGFLADWDSAFRDIFFYCTALIAVFFLGYVLKEVPENRKKEIIPIGLIFGGALGNVVDRMMRGSVVDFLSFHWNNERVTGEILGFTYDTYLIWPSFNVADMAISVGVFWLILLSFFKK